MEMGAKARRLKRDRGLSLIIVDYLQLVVPTNMGARAIARKKFPECRAR